MMLEWNHWATIVLFVLSGKNHSQRDCNGIEVTLLLMTFPPTVDKVYGDLEACAANVLQLEIDVTNLLQAGENSFIFSSTMRRDK